MKFSSMIRASLAVSLVSLLAACGGGSTTAPDAPAVAWASPAVFVTPGAANKSFALTGCTRDIYDDNEEEYTEEERPLYKASLQIASNGDMSILASLTTTGTATVIWSMAFADARNASWSVMGNTQTPTYSLYMEQEGRTSYKEINISGSMGERLTVDEDNESTDIDTDIDCTMTDKLALQVNADSGRAAKNLGTAAGVTTFDDYRADGRIEGGNAFWWNRNSDGPARPNDFLRFNLSTGELSGSTVTTGTYSTISLSLPSTTTSYGSYGESIERFDEDYDFKEAKIICLNRESEVEGQSFNVFAAAFGTKFAPNGYKARYSEEPGMEGPQGYRGGCNNR